MAMHLRWSPPIPNSTTHAGEAVLELERLLVQYWLDLVTPPDLLM
jgi:hypothetical protein